MFSKISHSVNDAAAAIGLGRTKLYELLSEGRLVAIKVGTKTLITDESLRALIAAMPRAEIRFSQKRAEERKHAA